MTAQVLKECDEATEFVLQELLWQAHRQLVMAFNVSIKSVPKEVLTVSDSDTPKRTDEPVEQLTAPNVPENPSLPAAPPSQLTAPGPDDLVKSQPIFVADQDKGNGSSLTVVEARDFDSIPDAQPFRGYY